MAKMIKIFHYWEERIKEKAENGGYWSAYFPTLSSEVFFPKVSNGQNCGNGVNVPLFFYPS